MRVIIEPDYESAAKWTANYVAKSISRFYRDKPSETKAYSAEAAAKAGPFVLGLPTGSSPLGIYEELITLNKKGVVSFKDVVTFNMDEYVNLPEEHPESYHSFMWNNFFSHIAVSYTHLTLPTSDLV